MGVRDSLADGHAPVEVFELISELEIPTLCKPLGGYLGAFLPAPYYGILISTKRDHHVQRYTAAHELGHERMGHQESFDNDGCIGFVARGGSNDNAQEIAADAFAAELLAPYWLVSAIVDRQGWTRTQLREPGTLYQLSLRLGLSYQATCWSLVGHNALVPTDASRLVKIHPKTSKQAALNGIEVDNYRRDVWHVTENDDRGFLLGSPNDVIMLELPEHAAAGATWNEKVLSEQGLEIVSDERKADDDDEIGGGSFRTIAVRGEGHQKIRLAEYRRWEQEPAIVNEFEMAISMYGLEEGIPRASRRGRH
jgi:Zn-dependent peptidase ImmA (M78 family)